MSYIGYTYFKKLKKLYDISKHILHLYGIRYFFFIMKLELKKQGFSAFKPDAKPFEIFSTPNFEDEYQKYFNNLNKKFQNDHVTFLKKSSNFNPQLSIVIIVDPNDLDSIQITLDSLINQVYKNYDFVLIPNSDQKITQTLMDKLSRNYKIQISFISENSVNLLEHVLSLNGDYIGFLQAGTQLSKFTLEQFVKNLEITNSDIFYFDHDYIDKNQVRTNPFFKPDFSLYLLRSTNYFAPFHIIKKSIIAKIANVSNFDDYEIILSSIEHSTKISHIPLPLCSIKFPLSYNQKTMISILSQYLQRNNIKGKVMSSNYNTCRINYELTEIPKVSIIIPTKNNLSMIKRCIKSIEKNTSYKNFEIIIIDNNSDHLYVLNYYKTLPYEIINYSENFNFSKMNNLAVTYSTGDMLLFLNDDTKILDSNWLNELVSICLQNDVGAVGPKLIYSDNTIQHAGIVFLKSGAGFHPLIKQVENSTTCHNFLNVIRDCSAVTGACMLVKRKIFEQIGGFDDDFDVYYGDADLCFQIIHAGYRVIYTPHTKLLHEGSVTIRTSSASHFDVENHQTFIKKWPWIKNGDPFYNPNLDWNYSLSNNDVEKCN